MRPWLLALALVAVACANDDDPVIPEADAGPPPEFRADRVGVVTLIEAAPDSFAGLGVYAALRDRPDVPAPERIADQGECSVWVHPAPGLCDPACSTGFCTAQGSCEPWPANRSAGTITVTGLAAPLTFVPSTWGYESQPAQPADLFGTGAAITVSAPGDDAPGFTLTATGVAPLVADLTYLTLEDGVDVEVTWEPAQSGRVQLMLLAGWHGAPWEAMLLCESDDDGVLTIPGDLVTAMPPVGETGLFQHPSTFVRFDRAIAETAAGPIELFVGSQRDVAFSHP